MENNNNNNNKLTTPLRLASMLIDHFAMTFIIMIIIMPAFAIGMFNAFNLDHDPTDFGLGGFSFLMLLGFSAYFNKDIFNGRSPAKRILKLQVIDVKTGEVANPLKCMVRNLTIIIWPIEVLFAIINPESRLGDKIAGTKVIYNSSPEKRNMDWSKFSIAILLALGFSFIVSLPFTMMSSKLNTEKVAYLEGSFNQKESERANILFTEELGGIIKKADFRIYNQIENDDRQYVAGVLYFENENDYENFEESEQQISSLLTSKFPLSNHLCFLKFVYKESNSISTRQEFYGLKVTKDLTN